MSLQPTVFIVDDDDAVRDQLAFTVKSVGYPVELFAGAKAFLAGFDPNQPGCLVLDVRMPDMDGLELQAHLNKEKCTLPIIMVSGHGDIPMAIQAIRNGALEFLEKPFREQVLLNCIRAAIKRDEQLRLERSRTSEIVRRFESLSPREGQILELIVAGQTNKLIAHQLSISHKTVESHRTKIMEKMDAQNLADLTRKVLSIGLFSEDPASA